MLRSVKAILGYTVSAADGDIGHVRDSYFDDQAWIVRYLVVDTGKFLPGRKVLLLPSVLKEPDWETRTFPVSLTKEEIKQSPEIDVDKPVSRQQQVELHEHFGWQFYWLPGAHHWAGHKSPPPPEEKDKKPEALQDDGDPHLRSVEEVMGYHLHSYDGEIGHVEDFIASDKNWHILYVVVDTRNWLPGRKVIISPGWIDHISWPEKKVYVEMNRELVKNSPRYDPSYPINREYEERLYDYYGRPRYWKD